MLNYNFIYIILFFMQDLKDFCFKKNFNKELLLLSFYINFNSYIIKDEKNEKMTMT